MQARNRGVSREEGDNLGIERLADTLMKLAEEPANSSANSVYRPIELM
jgi:hypothetical protein